jgi:hypothetical protein
MAMLMKRQGKIRKMESTNLVLEASLLFTKYMEHKLGRPFERVELYFVTHPNQDGQHDNEYAHTRSNIHGPPSTR